MGKTLNLILENVKEDANYAFKLFKENAPKVIAELISYTKKIFFWFFITFILTIPLITLGIIAESKTLIIAAGVIRACLTVALFIIISPIGILLEILKDGIPGSVRRYIDFIRGLFISELFLIAIIAWLPLKNNPDMIAMFILLSCIASFLGARFMSQSISAVIVGCLLIVTVASFIFPYSTQYVGGCVRRGDQEQGLPIRVDAGMNCTGLKKGIYKFFGDKGRPLDYYYFRDLKNDLIEIYQIQSKNTTRPSFGDQLYPITPFIIEDFQRLVCSREENERSKAKEDAEKREKEIEDKKKEMEAKNGLLPLPQPFPQPDSRIPIPTAPPKETAKPEKTQPPVAEPPKPVKPEDTPPVQPPPHPKPKKAYAYCIKSNIHAGELERQVSRQIAATIGEKILDANEMDIKTFTQQAEKIIVVDKVKFSRSDNSDEITCSASIFMRIVDLGNGDTINRVSTTIEQRAFDWEKARQLALDTAIKSANIKLRKAM